MPESPPFPPGAATAPLPAPAGAAPRPIEILGFPQAQLLDIAGPLQVFATANQLEEAAGRPPPYASRLVAAEAVVQSSAGLGLLAAPLPGEGEAVDTLLVAGGPGVHAACAAGPLPGWIAARAARARRTASVCSGAFLLGAAGLLAGRRVATHWRWCAELARRHPEARVEAEPIFLRDGAVWSSAGVTAGIDLALALVEEDAGGALALSVARHLVVFLKRPGGQAQFSAALSLQAAEDRFGALHRWIAAHPGEDLSLAALAQRAGMSERSFSRHHAAATGLTPARAVERLRVEAARRLLLDTSWPAKRIAQRCGFGTEETMRRSFLRLLGTSPGGYRERFRAAPDARGALPGAALPRLQNGGA